MGSVAGPLFFFRGGMIGARVGFYTPAAALTRLRRAGGRGMRLGTRLGVRVSFRGLVAVGRGARDV